MGTQLCKLLLLCADRAIGLVGQGEDVGVAASSLLAGLVGRGSFGDRLLLGGPGSTRQFHGSPDQTLRVLHDARAFHDHDLQQGLDGCQLLGAVRVRQALQGGEQRPGRLPTVHVGVARDARELLALLAQLVLGGCELLAGLLGGRASAVGCRLGVGRAFGSGRECLTGCSQVVVERSEALVEGRQLVLGHVDLAVEPVHLFVRVLDSVRRRCGGSDAGRRQCQHDPEGDEHGKSVWRGHQRCTCMGRRASGRRRSGGSIVRGHAESTRSGVGTARSSTII